MARRRQTREVLLRRPAASALRPANASRRDSGQGDEPSLRISLDDRLRYLIAHLLDPLRQNEMAEHPSVPGHQDQQEGEEEQGATDVRTGLSGLSGR
eukprot:764856-Hanusia_phi.AAC.3